MPPEGYSFWDALMAEQGVNPESLTVVAEGPDYIMYEQAPNYNVGDVIEGEIIEED